jgi:Uma2 family endonuclease
VSTPAKPEPKESAATRSVEIAPPVRLKLTADWNPTDEALIELSRLNESWDFELTANRELVFVAPEGLGSSARGVWLIAQVLSWSDAGGGGTLFGPQMGARLSDSSAQMPDIAWVSDKRWSGADADELALLPGARDLVVQIISKSDSATAQQEKMTRWMANGVNLGWLIDPFEEIVTIYRPNAEPEQLERPDSLSGENVCEGLEVNLERIWK